MGILNDHDPVETQEWVDSLRAVVQHAGVERARYPADAAARRGRGAPARCRRSLATTPYRNTIPPEQEAKSPGNRELEHKIRSAIRWNAMAMVLRANKDHPSSAATSRASSPRRLLYDIGFNHFWHAPSDDHGGDLIYVQGHVVARHLRARLRRGPPHRGAAAQLPPGESTARASPSYPHPWLMPDFWQFPTVSMGLGPLMAIYQARFLKYLRTAASPRPTDRKVWAFLGDGEMRRAGVARRDLAWRPRAPRQPDLRHQLQPAAPRRAGARQRQDHPGARGRLPRRRLERDQGRVGLAAGTSSSRKDKNGILLKRMEECVDGEYQDFKSKNGAYVREHFFNTPELKALVADLSDDDIWKLEPRRPRSVQGLRGLRRGGEAQGPADGDPRQDGQGLRHGRVRRRPDDHAPGEEDDGGCARSSSATASTSRCPTTSSRRCRSSRLPKDSPEIEVHAGAARRRSAATCRSAGASPTPLPAPPLSTFERLLQEHRATARSPRRWRSCRCCSTLVRDKTIGKHIVPIVPDESRTFGMEGMFRQLGI